MRSFFRACVCITMKAGKQSWGQLEFLLPGCVSMGLDNGLILKALNNENWDP